MTAGTAINGGRLASWFFDDRMSGGVASRPFDNVGKGGAYDGFRAAFAGDVSHQHCNHSPEEVRPPKIIWNIWTVL